MGSTKASKKVAKKKVTKKPVAKKFANRDEARAALRRSLK
jgi:hypothetical protein